MNFYFVIALLLLGVGTYFLGSYQARQIVGGQVSRLHSRPSYHGFKLVLACLGPALLVLIAWNIFSTGFYSQFLFSKFSDQLQEFSSLQTESFLRNVVNAATGNFGANVSELEEIAATYYQGLVFQGNIVLTGVCLALATGGLFLGFRSIREKARARQFVERFIRFMLALSSGIAILTTIGIVFSLLFETIRFFGQVSFFDFLFGLHWSPQSAFEGADSEGITADYSVVFGAVPLFAGTFLITGIAILLAAPVGLMSAIYLSDYASLRFRAIAKPLLEILAGIPTVVYGFFAVLTIAPAIRGLGENIGLTVASESALAAGLVMGIMIIPFVSSLSDDVINAVPQSLRDGSAAMGATKSETIRRVILPAALPGIVSAVLLAISRAIGETMIVVMAAGLAANLTINPLEAVTTVTVQIVTLLVGDQEFDSAKTLAAFALGLILFVLTLILNVIALRVVRKYREQYD